jgi:predicted DNA-binding protein
MTEDKEVATHVLVPEEHAERLRKLAARTRVNQSEYLREAVDDLLSKYLEEAEPSLDGANPPAAAGGVK